jgi:ABC-2 type transport system permease protein
MWIRLLMRINPLTYGTEALRALLFPESASTDLSLGGNFAVLALFTLVMFVLSFLIANRRTTKPAA